VTRVDGNRRRLPSDAVWKHGNGAFNVAARVIEKIARDR
jgi:hypothetical protein